MSAQLALIIYAAACAVIALIRAALDRRSTMRRTFWRLYLEVLNPLNCL